MSKADWLITILVGLVILAVTGVFCYQVGKANAPVIHDVTTDTVTVTKIDTVTREKPVYITRQVIDTMLVQVRDTIIINDSVYVAVDREQKVYEDSLYRAWVSGYRPALDSIELYQRQQTVYITETVTRPDPLVSLGFSAGYGLTVVNDANGNPMVRPGPTFSFGANINLLTLFRKRK